ncbi:glycosyltransferase family 4 protein [Prosthecobacter sp.]|uniref:glycosyltransferase family 4 protein n=1 Tax=Prosthecobacter sp. TaxID=1965333 RepID=UPI0037839610
MKVFFVINQHVFDGSAHALYCYRNCWWLARTGAGRSVELLVPGTLSLARDVSAACAEHFDLPPLENLRVTALPALRKAKRERGVTLNVIFHAAASWHLRRHARKGDVLLTASFPKLFAFLAGKKTLKSKLKCVYEVHQLQELDGHKDQPKSVREHRVLALADGLVTTTDSLKALLQKNHPATPLINIGLACAVPKTLPAPAPGATPFVLGYVGSLYRGQGIDWLIEYWESISAALPRAAQLKIAGGSPAEIEKLRDQIKDGMHDHISFVGQVRQSELNGFLSGVDALVIPALNQGRMPCVAITKAYDYLACQRPVLASDLPSIVEVMRPEQEALVFAAGDAAALAAQLRRLMSAPELGLELVQSANQRLLTLGWEARNSRYWPFLQASPD